MAEHAGLVIRARGRRWFLPAMLVEQVLSTPRLSPVPGSAMQMTLVEGRVLPVVALGEDGQHLVVCHAGSEPLGLTGVDVEDGGKFEAHEGHEGSVRVGDEVVAALDLSAELLKATLRTGAPEGRGDETQQGDRSPDLRGGT